MARPRVLAAAGCLALALGVAGCGGGGDGVQRTTPRPATTAPSSPADLARARGQVSKVVNGFARAGQELRDSVGGQSTPQQAATALRAFQGKVRSAATALSRLALPSAAAAAQRSLAAQFRAIAAACQASIDAGNAGDRTRFRSALRTFQARLNGPLGARARQAAVRLDAGLAAR
jgi:hypothetical protein